MNRNLNWRDVPLPERMQKLDTDRRGLPIPFLVLRASDGTPNFTVNDGRKHIQCLREDRCAICGQKLLRGRWFVGGPLSAFHPMGCYIDTPLHKECMEYALQVCPYLAAPKYSGRLDDTTIDYDKLPGDVILVDPTMLPDRPQVFVAVMAVRQKLITKPGQCYVKPLQPYLNVQYWRHGQQLDPMEGRKFVDEALAALDENTELQRPKVLTRGGSEASDRL
jgi:hypothetical protein